MEHRGARSWVGTDGVSIESEDAEDLPTHRALLSRGVMLLENLLLEWVKPGDYQLIALPLLFAELDASPVRAILLAPPQAKKVSHRLPAAAGGRMRGVWPQSSPES